MAHTDGHPSPHRRPRRHPAARVVGYVVICLAVVAAATFAVIRLGDGGSGSASKPSCDRPPVALSVDPRIATVVTEATADLGPWLQASDCLTVEVSSRASATTASEVARAEGQGLSAPLPDLWIPDSSVWLNLARGSKVGASRLPDPAVSVATSPVVIAMQKSRAQAMGWPDRQPSWRRLLATRDGTMQLATTDIDVDAAGLLSLDTLSGSRSSQALAGLSSRLAVPLLGDRSAAQLVVDGTADAIPSSEQDVLRANQDASDDQKLVAAYDPQLKGASLDFPLTAVRPPEGGDSAQVDHAMDVVREALLDPATQELVTAAGLRTSKGKLAKVFGEPQGVLPSVSVVTRTPPTATITSLITAWSSIGRRSRLLIVVDRSGSMAESLPGSRRTRAKLAQTSLRQVIRATAPDSDLGLWSFTTGLATGDSTVLVPIGPLGSTVEAGETRRAALLSAVDTLNPKLGGGTPLYDTVLASFRSAQKAYSYGRLNAVIVVTDGRNQDPRSISLPALLDDLKVEFDGVRPVRIIAIAYGDQVDAGILRKITDVTGGRTYQALTAKDVSGVFAQVLSDL